MSQLRQNAAEAKSMLGETGTLSRVAALASVYADEGLGAWCVGALDSSGDGSEFITAFFGPEGKARALEYAAEKYSGFRLHEAHQ